MDSGRFSIFKAARNAYAFAGKEWLYLLKLGLLPMGAQFATALFTQFQRPDASPIESYLWGLPAMALLAWFMFLETRLLLLGERVGHLTKDPAYLAERHHDMKLSMLTAILFNMGSAAATSILLTALDSKLWGINWLVTATGLLTIGAMFWGVRFGVVSIVAAVHYPIRKVLQKTWGMLFSLRLISVAMLCTFPVAFLFQLIAVTVLAGAADADVPLKLTDAQQIAITAAGAPLSLLAVALLNAGTAFALKEILGSKRDGLTT